MILYPAIDLKDGACVRLKRGDMASATAFNDQPADQAQRFASQGFEWLHVVDLNGAFEGRVVNAQAVSAILAAVTIPVQLGGGIRSMAQIEQWLTAGISRVIIGTQALREPQLVIEACKAFPNQIAVGIDAIGGMVAVEGWGNVSSVTATDLALRYEDAGVAAIIYTDIDRDGLMQGPNLIETTALATRIATPVILSGGVSSVADIVAINQSGAIAGAIIGRALYDGAIDPEKALKLVSH